MVDVTAPLDQAVQADWEHFKKKIDELLHIDLNAYRPAQMMRRLQSMMHRSGTQTFREFAAKIGADEHLRTDFLDFLTINVSEFYRNPEKFDLLWKVTLPQLLAQKQRLRIWSAGCSYGAEPYTLAMVLAQLTPGRQHYILGTDIDEGSLKRAAEANSYNAADLKGLPSALLSNFTEVGKTEPLRQAPAAGMVQKQFQVAPALRKTVIFRRHDLLKDPFDKEFDLILCRNVVIYFTDETKRTLYEGFYQALRPGGILFIGGTEMLASAREIGFSMPQLGFYQKSA